MIVRFLGRRIDQIAGNDDEIRTRQKSVEFFDAARQRRRSVNLLIRAQPNWLDMQIRNLRDQRPRRRHLYRHTGSGGNKRTAAGSIASPTRSPGLSTTEFGTSTIMGLAATPPIAARCRSPTKLTVSTCPQSSAPSAPTILIDSGRIITTTRSFVSALSELAASLPPGNTSVPPLEAASTMFAAPMNSATKRLAGAK